MIVASVPVSGNGGYSPPDGWAPTATGDYWWYASYSGDDNNSPAASACGAGMAKTVVEPATPSLFVDAPADGTVAGEIAASSLHGDLTNGVSPSGTVTFKVFGPQSTALASGWMAVRGARRRYAVDRGFTLSDHVDWPSLLEAIDGPMLVHGLQEMHRRPLTVPARRRDHPDADRLAIRYQAFRNAG